MEIMIQYCFTKVANIDKQEVGDKLSIDDINKQFSKALTMSQLKILKEEKIGFDPVGIDPIENKVSSEVGIISLDNIDPQATEPTCSLLFIQCFRYSKWKYS